MRTQTGEILGDTSACTPTAVWDWLWWRLRGALHQMLNRTLNNGEVKNPCLDLEMTAEARELLIERSIAFHGNMKLAQDMSGRQRR